MLIKVTQEDIDQGRKNVSLGKIVGKSCPVALAIRRNFPHFQDYVGRTKILRYGEPEILFQQSVIDWINAFDTETQEVEPFEFELNI